MFFFIGARTDRATDYLRRVGRTVAEELGGEGMRVVPLTPEAIRDLAARQLDPAGWLQAEPVSGTAWRWPVGGLPIRRIEMRTEEPGDSPGEQLEMAASGDMGEARWVESVDRDVENVEPLSLRDLIAAVEACEKAMIR